jgi:hypothetical protein
MYQQSETTSKFRLENSNNLSCCHFCDPKEWLFNGTKYSPDLTLLYARNDGCIPSTVNTSSEKFIVPWRYKNKRTGDISWRIYHLSGDRITGAENETIVVNLARDRKLRAVHDYAVKNHHKYTCFYLIRSRYPAGSKLVEFLLKVVQETLGNYGLAGGPTSADADKMILELMMRYYPSSLTLRKRQNFVLLCEVEIGVCRHKALLLKILCDAVGLKCALITGYSTAGRHQWNIVSLDSGDYLIDPTSRHFSWAKQGSNRTKGYKVTLNESLGHAGFTFVLKN